MLHIALLVMKRLSKACPNDLLVTIQNFNIQGNYDLNYYSPLLTLVIITIHHF